MENGNYENPFADNPELLEATTAFAAHLEKKFPCAQSLVDALETIIANLCDYLANLTDIFAQGSTEFIEETGEGKVIFKRYQVLTAPNWLRCYLSPTLFIYLLSLWKDEHADETVKMNKLLARVRKYEGAWQKLSQVLLIQTGGNVHAFELEQIASKLCNQLSLAFSAKGLSEYFADYLRTKDEMTVVLRQIAAELAKQDLAKDSTTQPTDDRDIEAYSPTTRARYTQMYAAGLIGVTKNTIANWENGRSSPPPGYSKALRWCKGFELVEFANNYRARIHNEKLVRHKGNLKRP